MLSFMAKLAFKISKETLKTKDLFFQLIRVMLEKLALSAMSGLTSHRQKRQSKRVA